MVLRGLLIIAWWCVLLSTALAEIEVSAPGQQQIPLALTRFLPMSGEIDKGLADEVHEALSYDFDLAGMFEFVDPRAFLGDAGSHLVGYAMAVLAILPSFHTAEDPRPLETAWLSAPSQKCPLTRYGRQDSG